MSGKVSNRSASTRCTSAEVEADPAGAVRQLNLWADGLDLLSVHVDVDFLDQTQFPIAEEQRDTPGLTLDGLAQVMTGLMAHPAARVLTVCEVNPNRPQDPPYGFRLPHQSPHRRSPGEQYGYVVVTIWGTHLRPRRAHSFGGHCQTSVRATAIRTS